MAIPSPTKAAPIAQGTILRGIGAWIFVPTIANFTAPTSAEISAGTDYSAQISGVSGWDTNPNNVDYGNIATRNIGSVPGTVKFNDGQFMFNCSRNPAVADARSTISDGTDGVTAQSAGYWIQAPNGLVTSAKIRVFASACSSANLSTDPDAVLELMTTWAVQQVSGFVPVPTA